MEDVLARRIRLLYYWIGVKEAESAEDVTHYIAAELGKNERWIGD
ncbi:MAG: hypothetical protein Q4A74_07660 [Cardiobacteriaceae bacterium]|nr:hypothetical protein [Cardiobacteriaceae bacterium]